MAVSQDTKARLVSALTSAKAADEIADRLLENAESITVDSSGNLILSSRLGVGTSSPSKDVEIESTNNTTLTIDESATGVANSIRTVSIVDFKGRSTTDTELSFAKIICNSNDATDGGEDGALVFQTVVAGTLATRFVVNGGNVGVGDTSPDEKLTVDGNIAPTTDDTYDIGTASLRWDDIHATNGTIQTSDERKKDNIKPLTDASLEIINAMRPVSFVWKDYTQEIEVSPAEAERVETRVVTHVVTKTRDVYTVVGGKVVKSTETYDVEEPLYDDLPVVDENGKSLTKDGAPVYRKVPRTEDVTVPAKGAVVETVEKTFSRTHFGLIAQEVESTLGQMGINTSDFAAFVYDAATDSYSVRYTDLIPLLIKSIQILSAKVTALEDN